MGVPASAWARCAEFVGLGQQAIRLARAARVRIGFGTDLLGPLGDEQLHGLRLQAEADGIINALRSATSENAAILGRPDLGRIAEGAAADVLIVEGDVLEHPENLWSDQRRTVIAGGRVR